MTRVAVIEPLRMRGDSVIVARVGRIDRDTASTAAAPTAPRMAAHLAAAAPVLLAISIAARFALTYLVPHGANFVDLHVYVGGAETLGQPGKLYDYVYADQTPDFPLPARPPPSPPKAPPSRRSASARSTGPVPRFP